MSRFELLSLLAALLSVVLSTVALVRTRRFERLQSELGELQRDRMLEEQSARGKADVRIALCRESNSNDFFEITNFGPAIANDVALGFFKLGPRKAPLVIPEQFSRMFPAAQILPNETRRIRAVLTLDTPDLIEGELTWTDPDSAPRSHKFTLSL